MGHIIQTKQDSRASGGPQYYLHGLDPHVASFLSQVGACPAWLGTPYGIIDSGLIAVAKDKVLRDGELRDGKVGHHRIQRQEAKGSVESQVRHWYAIKGTTPLYQIAFREIAYHSATTRKNALIVLPESYQLQGRRTRKLPLDFHPLTFTQNHRSILLSNHLDRIKNQRRTDVEWVTDQIGAVLEDHLTRKVRYVGEEDLLRTSGALHRLGLRLGPYRRKGYDCFSSSFQFLGYPAYPCPIEIKKRSSGFSYQILKHTQPERAAVLCLVHDPEFTPSPVVDVIELKTVHEYLDT